MIYFAPERMKNCVVKCQVEAVEVKSALAVSGPEPLQLGDSVNSISVAQRPVVTVIDSERDELRKFLGLVPMDQERGEGSTLPLEGRGSVLGWDLLRMKDVNHGEIQLLVESDLQFLLMELQ